MSSAEIFTQQKLFGTKLSDYSELSSVIIWN